VSSRNAKPRQVVCVYSSRACVGVWFRGQLADSRDKFLGHTVPPELELHDGARRRRGDDLRQIE